jgi:macrolide transport system ATP-binding/permease protein
MTLCRRLRAILLAVRDRTRLESEMDAELRFHIEACANDLVRDGIPREEALRRARVAFGGIEQVKEACRDVRGTSFVEGVVQDARYGLRILRRNPGFAAAAIATLAIGIAVNTAVFSAFDALVLRPRPVKDPDGLAVVFRTTPGDDRGRLSYPDYTYLRDHSRSFADLALFAFGMAVSSSDLPAGAPQATTGIAAVAGFHLPQRLEGTAQPIGCYFVSGNYFGMLGAVPLRGRLLLPEDDRPEAAPVVVVSANLWEGQLRSDPTVVGSTLHVNGVPFTVVGVTPVDYAGTLPNAPGLWAPVAAKVRLGALSPQDLENHLVIAGAATGRLRPGVSLSEAQAELDVLAERLRADRPHEPNSSLLVLSGRNDAAQLQAAEWSVIVAALSAVALLLVIACANVASLLLARAAVRRREIAVRLALGAGRGRLLRQLLTESLLMAVLAAAIGLPLASWMLRLLMLEVSAALPAAWGTLALTTSPDARIFGYTLLLSFVAGIGFGLAPALHASRRDVGAPLNDNSRGFGHGPSGARLRGILIAGQMAACVVLLVSSALLLRGSGRALELDPGYESRRVVCLELYSPANLRTPSSRMLQVNRDLIRGISGLPGVRSVAQASRDPIAGIRRVVIAPAGAAAASAPASAGYSYVTPNYFETLSIPIVRGRSFTSNEAEGEAPVVVVSEATARRFWPGEDAVGKRLRIGGEAGAMSIAGEATPSMTTSEVVGVARDVRSLDLRRPDDSYVYLPLSQGRRWTFTLLVRTEVEPRPLLRAMGQAVRRVAPDLPVVGAPLQAMVSMNPFFVISRVGGLLASLVGALGVLLACLGVYGMIRYCVEQRTHEIGIRMALGARAGEVLGVVVREGFRPILAGMVVGITAAAAISRVLASTLFGLDPFDAVSFLGVSASLGLVACAATIVPARRATRVDPIAALRHD